MEWMYRDLVFILVVAGVCLAGGAAAFNCAGLTNGSACVFTSGACAPITITVPVSTMNANFTSDNRSGTAPLTVQFYDASYGTPTEWRWDFGDGGTSRERYPKHTYTSPGKYDVTLTISQNHGEKNGTVWSWTVMTYESTKTEQGYVLVAGTPETRGTLATVSQRSSALAGVMSGASPAGYKPLKTASGLKRNP